MKVYIVTEGEYSGYGISAVFTDEDKAWQYASLDDDRRIEVYDTDTAEIDSSKTTYIQITYDFCNNRIYSQNIVTDIVLVAGLEEAITPYLFVFQIANTKKNYYEFLKSRERNKSKYILKIAQDEFAKFMDKMQMSREELMQKSLQDSVRMREDFNRRFPNYMNYTTSI